MASFLENTQGNNKETSSTSVTSIKLARHLIQVNIMCFNV